MYKRQGRDSEGYQTVGIVCLVLALLDAVLLLNVCERPVEETVGVQLLDVLQPVKDKSYRPLLLYNILSSVASGIATPFLIVYQLRVLGLSHTFLASAGIVAAMAGMAGSYLWGRFSDRHTWDWTIHRSASIGFLCTLFWAFVTPKSAPFIAPVLMTITTVSYTHLDVYKRQSLQRMLPGVSRTNMGYHTYFLKDY